MFEAHRSDLEHGVFSDLRVFKMTPLRQTRSQRDDVVDVNNETDIEACHEMTRLVKKGMVMCDVMHETMQKRFPQSFFESMKKIEE